MSDVPAEVATRQGDAVEGVIGSLAGFLQRGAGANDVEHPATEGHQLAILFSNSCRTHALGLASGSRAVDHTTLFRGLWVALSGEDDGHRVTVLPTQFRQFGQFTGRHRVQHPSQRSLQQLQNRLGFRITETAVEFDNFWPVASPSDTGIEQAGVWHTIFDHLLGDGRADLIDNALHTIFWQPRQRGVRTHATRVRPLVTLTDTLEILRWQQRHDVLTINEAEQRDLRAIQEALQQHRVAGFQHCMNVLQRLGAVVGHHDTLAGS